MLTTLPHAPQLFESLSKSGAGAVSVTMATMVVVGV